MGLPSSGDDGGGGSALIVLMFVVPHDKDGLGLVAGLVPAEALRQAAVTLQSLDAAGGERCFADLVTKVASSTQTAPSGQAALASAQRRIGQGRQAVVEDPRHPYYWAAFVLVG